MSFKKIQKKIATNFKRVSDGKVSTNIVVMIVSFRKNQFRNCPGSEPGKITWIEMHLF